MSVKRDEIGFLASLSMNKFTAQISKPLSETSVRGSALARGSGCLSSWGKSVHLPGSLCFRLYIGVTYPP